MNAPDFFVKELKKIAPELYPLYFPKYQKWMIVKDSKRPIPGLTDTHPVNGNPVIIELIVEDPQGKPLSLEPFVLDLIKKIFWETRNMPKIDWLMDQPVEEQKRIQAAQKLRLAMMRDFKGKVRKFLQTETFVMPGGK